MHISVTLPPPLVKSFEHFNCGDLLKQSSDGPIYIKTDELSIVDLYSGRLNDEIAPEDGFIDVTDQYELSVRVKE